MAHLALRTASEAVANASSVESTETGANLFNDRICLITATTLLGALQGITTTLYCMTIYALLRNLFRRNVGSAAKAEWRQTTFYIFYTSVLFVLATLYTAGNSQNAIVAYVDNRLYPGGPYMYYITHMTRQPVMVMTDLAAVIIFWMTDALIIYRFIVFYYQVPYVRWVIPLPCAMYVGVVVLNALVFQEEAGLGKVFYLSEDFILTYNALSFALNVLCTLMIAARLYYHQVQLERIFGPITESPYMSIAALFIESAALYATWPFLFLVLSLLNSPAQIFVLGTTSQIQVIAPLLIILWTARGKSWDSNKTYGGSSGGEEISAAEGGSRTGVGREGKPSNAASPSRIAQLVRVARLTPVSGNRASVSQSDMKHVGADVDADGNPDGGIDLIELGLCGPKSPSPIYHRSRRSSSLIKDTDLKKKGCLDGEEVDKLGA